MYKIIATTNTSVPITTSNVEISNLHLEPIIFRTPNGYTVE